MIDKADITVAILAGGKSSRFGTPKEHAIFRDRKLIQISLEIAGKISTNKMIISGNRYPELSPNIPVVKDIIPDLGPIGGIYTAMHQADTPYIATLPCDMPLLTPRVYQILATHQKDIYPVAAISESGLEPLVGIWPVSNITVFLESICHKRLSLRNVLAQTNAATIYIPDYFDNYSPDIFFNINYRSDLKYLKNQTSTNNLHLP